MARRTLGDGMTPEEEEFLTGKPSQPKATKSKPKPKEQKEKLPMRQTALKKPEFAPANEAVVMPQYQKALVGLNTRLEQQNSDALLRASVERKIQRQSRAAMQDIVNEALAEWLKKNGYLN